MGSENRILMVDVFLSEIASSSGTVQTTEAHATERGGFPQRAAQNSTWHRLFQRWCEHLHSEFTFVLFSLCQSLL